MQTSSTDLPPKPGLALSGAGRRSGLRVRGQAVLRLVPVFYPSEGWREDALASGMDFLLHPELP